jgi:hypothetical protein
MSVRREFSRCLIGKQKGTSELVIASIYIKGCALKNWLQWLDEFTRPYGLLQCSEDLVGTYGEPILTCYVVKSAFVGGGAGARRRVGTHRRYADMAEVQHE